MTKNFIQTSMFAGGKYNDELRNAVCATALALRTQGSPSQRKHAALFAALAYGVSQGSVYNWMGRLGYSQAFFNANI